MKRWIGIGMAAMCVVPCIGLVVMALIASWPYAAIGLLGGAGAYAWIRVAAQLMGSKPATPSKLGGPPARPAVHVLSTLRLRRAKTVADMGQRANAVEGQRDDVV